MFAPVKRRNATQGFTRSLTVVVRPLALTPRPRSITSLGIPSDAATAITIAAFGTAQIAGSISVTTANKPSLVSHILNVGTCNVFDSNDFPEPDDWQLIPVHSLFGSNSPIDETQSMTVATASFVAVVVLMSFVYATRAAESTVRSKAPNSLLVGLFNIVVTYYGPNTIGSAEALMRFPGTGSSAATVGAVSTLFLLVLNLTFARIVWVHRSLLQNATLTTASRMCWFLGDFYEGARRSDVWFVRMYAFEDLSVAIATVFISGIYPTTISGCTAAAMALLLLAVAHLAYLIAVRPQESRLELLLAVFNAVILFVVALLTSVVLLKDTTTAEDTLMWAVLAANVYYFAQAIILCVVALVQMLRSHGGNHNASPASAAPLLQVPVAMGPMASSSTPAAAVTPQLVTSVAQPSGTNSRTVVDPQVPVASEPLAASQTPAMPQPAASVAQPNSTNRRVVLDDDSHAVEMEHRASNPLNTEGQSLHRQSPREERRFGRQPWRR